jgi:hypothetical protein
MNSRVTTTRKKGTWILSSVYIQSLWKQLCIRFKTQEICVYPQRLLIQRSYYHWCCKTFFALMNLTLLSPASLFTVSNRTSRSMSSPRAWRRTLGRPPQWVLPTKKTSFHLWISICTELRGKCGICKDAIRQLRWSELLLTYQSGLSSSGVGNSSFFFFRSYKLLKILVLKWTLSTRIILDLKRCRSVF